MNILIAPDSFKDALSALQVCHALEAGIRSANPKACVRLCPLADGGEGTYEALASSLGLHKVGLLATPIFSLLLLLTDAQWTGRPRSLKWQRPQDSNCSQ